MLQARTNLLVCARLYIHSRAVSVEEFDMVRILIATFAVTAFLASPVLAHKKPGAHAAAHSTGKACKGEFMYSKGGQCMDARKKATS
jgi:hypothetical protein